jgi:Rrf2 family protein
MQITARIEYGLQAMLALAAAAPATMTGAQLAGCQHLPISFLHTILGDLRRNSLVYSVRGTSGGYILTRPASDITVADVITALDGAVLGVRGQPASKTTYHGAAVGLQTVWIAAEEAVLKVLHETTLADLLSRRVNNAPA